MKEFRIEQGMIVLLYDAMIAWIHVEMPSLNPTDGHKISSAYY